jgi:hypothetical protein
MSTHVMMTGPANKVMDAPTQSLREAYERSVTRLRRTFLAQMDAFKKYRANHRYILNFVLTIVAHVQRVTVWKISIRPDADLPDQRQGWVQAATEREALALANDISAPALPSKSQWPGATGAVLHWSN